MGYTDKSEDLNRYSTRGQKKGVSTSRNKARRQRYIPLSIQGEWKIRTLPVHTNTLWSRGKTIHIWSHLKASLRPEEVGETDQTSRDNTYVDNLMKTGERLEEMVRFKSEATQILQQASFQFTNRNLILESSRAVG